MIIHLSTLLSGSSMLTSPAFSDFGYGSQYVQSHLIPADPFELLPTCPPTYARYREHAILHDVHDGCE